MIDKKIISKPVKNSGFIYAPEQPEDWILGVNSLIEPPIIFSDGHGWHEFRAKSEMQFNKLFDSYSCVLFATAKCLVVYLKKVYEIDTTVSEMFNAFYAGVVQGRGTTVRQALESFRQYGWVEDKDYPFTANTTAKQFFSRPPIAIQIKAKGKLTEWEVHWEQLDFSGDVPHDKIIEALKRTPIICSGFAWASYYGDGIYKDYNNPANHCFPVDDWADNPNYDLIAYDSYPQDFQYDENSEDAEFEKKLAKDFRIWSSHRIWLEPIDKKKLNLILKLKNMFEKICRDVHGGLWFVKPTEKDGIKFTGKQKIEDWLSFAGAIIDEIGCKTLTDKELEKFLKYKFFGK